MFANTIINFIIVAFSVLLLIRGINKMKREEEAPPEEPTTKECPHFPFDLSNQLKNSNFFVLTTRLELIILESPWAKEAFLPPHIFTRARYGY